MEFYRWILIATGIVLLIVAFLMGRNKTNSPNIRRASVVKPIADNSPESKLPEPTPDPLNGDNGNGDNGNGGRLQDGTGFLQHEQASSSDDYTDSYAQNQGIQNQEFQSREVENNFEAESFSTTGDDQNSNPVNDEFDEIDIALDSESYRGNPDHDASTRVTSFASAVQAANAQDDIVSADMDDFDENFYEEFESYNGPVQLEEFEEKLVTIHVVALSGRRFYGNDLKSLFEKHGYKFGRMSLYHCALEGEKVFSIANMVKPGTFNEDQMSIFETPGITLFMRLPIELDAGVAFDFLLQEATELAHELDGQLRDGNRNPLSQQTIQHMREDIQQYVFRTKRVLQPVT